MPLGVCSASSSLSSRRRAAFCVPLAAKRQNVYYRGLASGGSGAGGRGEKNQTENAKWIIRVFSESEEVIVHFAASQNSLSATLTLRQRNGGGRALAEDGKKCSRAADDSNSHPGRSTGANVSDAFVWRLRRNKHRYLRRVRRSVWPM